MPSRTVPTPNKYIVYFAQCAAKTETQYIQNTENRHTDKRKNLKNYENIKTLGNMQYTYTH